VNKVKEILTMKQQNTNSINSPSDSENLVKTIKMAYKENSFHISLIILIEAMYKGEQKLPKQFLTNLSGNILNLTLTDDLEISGMLHGLIIYIYYDFVLRINRNFVK
jgi:hypothetical protein